MIHKTSGTIVALGDSITWGYPGEHDRRAGVTVRRSVLWTKMLEDALGRTVINAGVNGESLSAMARRLDEDVLARNPSLVILSGGSNDAAQGFSTEEMIRRTQLIESRLRQHSIDVVYGLPLEFVHHLVRSNWGIEDEDALRRSALALDGYREWLRSWADHFIDFPAALNAAGRPLDELLPDGIHPSAEAYRLMGEAAIVQFGRIGR